MDKSKTIHTEHIQHSDLPAGLSKPAQRALAVAGYTRLEEISRVSEDDLLSLHGMGPKGVNLLRQALAKIGLSFAENLD